MNDTDKVFVDGREDVRALTERAGFKQLTDLQEKSFECRAFYDVNKWLFILGATGSGKTLVALMSYFYEQRRAAAQGRDYKMLFTVPYRALASQKFDEITDIARKFELPLKIVQSTSENLLDDPDILTGRIDIAVIINEKVFMFASADHTFLSKYDLIVLDEVALVQDRIRGLKTDFIMLQARRRPDVRVIALGTPFYNWKEYVETFRFTEIQEERRPIELKTLPIYYDMMGVKRIEPDCKAISVRNFSARYFERYGRSFNGIVAELCRYHIRRGEKILIFFNNRQLVRETSRLLQRDLTRSGFLQPWIGVSACRDYILEKIQADSDEILYGTMDVADYRAFAHGVSYHNANLPSTLRYLIEKDFLSVDGKLKIICSTETLAYGVNSNADVVIIPHMAKRAYDKSDQNLYRFLYPNEYMNYAGRAGRLNPELAEQKSIGYVYPLINLSLGVGKNRELAQAEAWKELELKIADPDVNFSQYLNVEEDYYPFYVLSLFVSSKRSNTEGITRSEIKIMLRELPLPAESNVDDEILDEPIQRLLDHKLITRLDNDIDEEDEPEYTLTDVGKKLAGFVILFGDFEKLLRLINTFIMPKNFFEVDLFTAIVGTEGIVNQSKIITGTLSGRPEDVPYVQQTIVRIKKLLLKSKERTSPVLTKWLLNVVDEYERHSKAHDYQFLEENEFQSMRILAAILLWRGTNCTPEFMYNELKIYYEQMWRLLEIICYRLEVIKFSLPLAPSAGKRLLKERLTSERMIEATKWLDEIIADLSYQPSKEMRETLGIEFCDLYKMQRLRKVARIYNELLECESKAEKLDPERKKTVLNAMKRWANPDWRNAVRERFAELLKDYGSDENGGQDQDFR